ncbi:MAG TPA: alkaline phosphatase family protein [Anaerolineales bacterium]|nr:alkaline phosphatase family protein [Anaerolineales bacterium]
MRKMLSVLIGFTLILTSLQACAPQPTSSATEPPASSTTTPPNPTAANTATATQVPRNPVVLISWDGSRADYLYDLMDTGVLPTFSSFVKDGIRAEFAQTIDPSLTAAAHNSIASGSFPTHTGITSNSFHVTGDDFYWYRVGFNETMDDAKPIWVTAKKNGLTTATVFFVGGSPSLKGQEADYTVGFGIEDAYSTQRTLELAPAESWTDLPASYSAPLEGEFSIQSVGSVFVCVIDSTDDGTMNYDTVVLNKAPSGLEPAQILKVDQWGSLVLLPRAYSGADFLIQEITSEKVVLFQSGVNHNNASPADMQDEINQKFGFFPPGADYYAMEHGWITETDYLSMLERQSNYMADVASWMYTTYHPDLLLTWQDPFDSAGHQFLMKSERQLNYSAEKAAEYDGYYKDAARIADQALQTMLEAFDLQKTTVFMVGDHGMTTIHTSVFVNTILEQAGLLTLDSQNAVIINKSKAFAIGSGGAVHVYINLVGREKGGGIVTEAEYPTIQAQIIDLFTNLVDPATGEKVFGRVLPHDQLGSISLDHPNSGDIFAQANPGYVPDSWRGNDFIFAPAEYYGQHGYDSSLADMHTIFFAAGAGITPMTSPIPSVRVVDYAPTIAYLLGFQPAQTVDGSVIPYFKP